MSGSDLAPFVAATLRYRVMSEVWDENQELKRENQQLKRRLLERNPRRSVRPAGLWQSPR